MAGPLWAQATLGGDNVFARLVKTGKKVLRKVLQKQFEPAVGKEIPKPTWSLRAQTVQVSETSSRRLIGGFFPKRALQTQAAEARRRAALRLIRDSRKVPVFAFVGLSLGASLDQKKGETDDVLCSGIRVCQLSFSSSNVALISPGDTVFGLVVVGFLRILPGSGLLS